MEKDLCEIELIGGKNRQLIGKHGLCKLDQGCQSAVGPWSEEVCK